MGKKIAVAIGFQRDSRFLVRVYSTFVLDAAAAITAELGAVGGGTVAVPASIAEPGPTGAAIDAVFGRLNAKASGHLAKFPARTDLVIAIPDGSAPVRGLRLAVQADGETIPVAWETRQCALDLRVPVTEAEFKAHFTFRRGRHIDPETILHAAADCVGHYFAQPPGDRKNLAYICNAFVILIYKSMERDSADYAALIESRYRDIFGLIDRIVEAKGIRENRYQQKISLQTAMWQYWIAKDDGPRFLAACQETIVGYVPEREFRITYAYNLGLTFLIYAVAQAKRGDAKLASQLLLTVTALFRRAAAIETRHIIWFEELAISHRSAYLALKALSDLKEFDGITAATVEQIAEHAARVKTPAFVARTVAFLQKTGAPRP